MFRTFSWRGGPKNVSHALFPDLSFYVKHRFVFLPTCLICLQLKAWMNLKLIRLGLIERFQHHSDNFPGLNQLRLMKSDPDQTFITVQQCGKLLKGKCAAGCVG